MSQDQNVNFISGPSAADLTSYPLRIVKQTSTGYTYTAGATVADKPEGILYNAPNVKAIGDGCMIAVSGNPKVKLGGTVVKGDQLCSTTDGTAIKLNTGTTVISLYTIGTADESGDINDVIEFTINIHLVDID